MRLKSQEQNDCIIISKINDCVRLSEERNLPCFLGFLNDKEQNVALNALKHLKFTRFVLYGGTDGAQRKMLGVFPKLIEPNEQCFPISFISFTYNKKYILSHRDFLGTLMALGLQRDSVGDIIITDESTVLVIKKDLKRYVLTQVVKVGSVGVTANEIDNININIEQNFININCTVSSLRLDNIVSAITKTSRGKACKLITSGLVSIDYLEIVSVSAGIKMNDVITIRGFGKFIINDVCGMTKKDRQKLIVKQYC